MIQEYTTPAGRVYNLYENMLLQPHLLIAGATGSGKSVVINGLISTALYNLPTQSRFILIDPKRVELAEYRHLPHVVSYASEPANMIGALRLAMDICETRYKDMQRRAARMYDGSDLYVFIDELADLLTVAATKRAATEYIQRLCQIGRAARVHIVGATQRPTADIIGAKITCNMDARVALHTRSAQESRNITGFTGCENLPRYGYGYYMRPGKCELYKIPMIDDTERAALIHYWKTQKPKIRLFAR